MAMSFAPQMLQSHPSPAIGGDALAACIRLDLDCADLCDVTGRIVSRQTAFDRELAAAALQACATACRRCGDECELHARHGMEHCRVCAEACRRCEQACNTLMSQLAA